MFGTPTLAFHTAFGEQDPPEEQPVWTGTLAFGRLDAGLASAALPGEPGSQWFYDGSDWVGTATQLADEVGRVEWPGPSTEPGLVERTVLLEADGTCGRQLSVRLPAGAAVVITDIDETLTTADAEFYHQVTDASYLPAARADGAALFQAWADRDVQPIYITARPHVARAETRLWLEDLGFPPGPLITSEELVIASATTAYKALWVGRIVDDLGWDVVAAYGNATTDIDAYLTRIPAEKVFIVGEHGGEQGTVAVDEDWSATLAALQAR